VLNMAVYPVFRSMDDRPHNINATDGDTVTVSCKAAAEPKASIVWLRNGVPLQRMLLYLSVCICFSVKEASDEVGIYSSEKLAPRNY